MLDLTWDLLQNERKGEPATWFQGSENTIKKYRNLSLYIHLFLGAFGRLTDLFNLNSLACYEIGFPSV